jgi:flagellin-like protein
MNMRLNRNSRAVSPVIGIIIAVAITVILASIAYVWFMSLTEDVGETTVEPLRVSAELNIERVHEEFALEIIIGRNINWDDYTVTLNYKEVDVPTGTISNEGDVVYFDYQGPPLAEGNIYTYDIIDNLRNTVVFTDDVLAQSYPPEGTGIYGYVASANDGRPLAGALVYLYSKGSMVNSTTTDPSGAYFMDYEGGIFTLEVSVDETNPETFGASYESYSAEVALGKYYLTRVDVALTPIVPETSTVTGFVFDKESGEPIAGAQVRITDNKLFSKINITGASGYFEMHAPAKNLSLFCERDGYKKSKMSFTLEKDGAKSIEIRLELLPIETARIYGRVYDKSTGAVLEHVNVFVETSYGSNFSKSDDGGNYEVHVAPGNATLFVNTAGYNLWTDSIDVLDKQSYQIDIYLDPEQS